MTLSTNFTKICRFFPDLQQEQFCTFYSGLVGKYKRKVCSTCNLMSLLQNSGGRGENSSLFQRAFSS